MTDVKICGITTSEAANAAMDAGADYLGFVFYRQSPRYIDPERAAGIILSLNQKCKPVGVFVQEPWNYIENIMEIAGIKICQVHGMDSQFPCPLKNVVIAAHRFSDTLQLTKAAKLQCDMLIIDSGEPGIWGGTGVALNWAKLAEALDQFPNDIRDRIMLAGGLTAENVEQAIKCVKPRAVDVSSGVEIQPGHKSTEKMREFIHAVRAADQELSS